MSDDDSFSERVRRKRRTLEDTAEVGAAAGVGVLGIALLVGAGYVLYEAYKAVKKIEDEIENDLGLPPGSLPKGVASSALGLPLYHVVEGWWDKAFNDGGDISRGWYAVLGLDLYNSKGIYRFAWTALVNNSIELAKIHGPFPVYFSKLTPKEQETMQNEPGPGDPQARISPFNARQNLEKLPFANDLRATTSTGAFKAKGTVLELKEYIWTEFDKIPEEFRLEKAAGLVIDAIEADTERFNKYVEKGDTLEAAIVWDRMTSYRKLLHLNADMTPDKELRTEMEKGLEYVESWAEKANRYAHEEAERIAREQEAAARAKAEQISDLGPTKNPIRREDPSRDAFDKAFKPGQ